MFCINYDINHALTFFEEISEGSYSTWGSSVTPHFF